MFLKHKEKKIVISIKEIYLFTRPLILTNNSSVFIMKNLIYWTDTQDHFK